MARNNHPEKTIEKILDTSFQLFAKKGYEKTTIQDIVDALGMSKGAIYHHFKSKEDILEALSKRSFEGRTIYGDEYNQLNGLQKIQHLLRTEFTSNEKHRMDELSMSIVRVPQYLSLFLKKCIEENAVVFKSMIDEGIQDGSIHVEDPQMIAEIFMLLSNIWMNPFLWERDEAVFIRQIHAMNTLTRKMGLPILDDELINILIAYFRKTTTA